MNLYLLSQTENTDYNTFDSCIVAAHSSEEARLIHPWHYNPYVNGTPWNASRGSTWAFTPEGVTVKFIGVAAEDIEPGVVLASFNAG
jgi:hypothetical protein